MEPRGGNRWQSAQIEGAQKRRKQAKTVAVGCHRLPESFHGKEGVDGSSPSEGSAKALQISGFLLSSICIIRQYVPGLEPIMELRDLRNRASSSRTRPVSARIGALAAAIGGAS